MFIKGLTDFHIAFTHPNGCQNGDLVDPFDVSCTQLPASEQIKADRMINELAHMDYDAMDILKGIDQMGEKQIGFPSQRQC